MAYNLDARSLRPDIEKGDTPGDFFHGGVGKQRVRQDAANAYELAILEDAFDAFDLWKRDGGIEPQKLCASRLAKFVTHLLD